MDPCACGNAARYTAIDGSRSCALCCIGDVAVRDSDMPELLVMLVSLLDWLDHQKVADGAAFRMRLRMLVGQVQR